MQFAELNDVTLHFQILSGPADKPTLVFVNSLGTDFRIWRDVIVNFAGHYPIVVYDKRGHGLSSVGKTPYAMDDHANDLIALLDHLNISNSILCGVSVGGMIAQAVYAKKPELIEALVLCDTAHKIGTFEMWNQRMAAISAGGIAALAEPILDRWFSPEFHEEQPAALQGYYNMLTRQPVEGYLGTCAALRDADYTKQAQEIAVPCLCVVGEKDGSTPPELVQEMADLIEGAEFHVIEGAGHLPSIEQPDKLTELMKKFFARQQVIAANSNGTLQ